MHQTELGVFMDVVRRVRTGKILGGLGALAILLVAGCVTTVSPEPQVTSNASVATSGFGGLLNQQRGAQGLALVSEDGTLEAAARAHAADMVSKGYFSHTGKNGSSVATRIRSAGGCRAAVAENIAEGQANETAVFNAWMGSSAHRGNMLYRKYNRFGLGRAGDTWVLVLAGPCV